MTFDPATFTVVARDLLQRSTDKEARTRTMLGRAYYALHLAIRSAVCTTHGVSVDTRVNHSRLIDELYRAGEQAKDPTLTALAKQLDELHGRRTDADYKLNPPPNVSATLQKPAAADSDLKAVQATLRALGTMNFRPVQLNNILK